MAFLSGVALTVGGVFGIRGSEEPAYTVVGHAGPAEIRAYGTRIAAETTVEGSDRDALSTGFQRLASYIFGANRGGVHIAMTAPVSQVPHEGAPIGMTMPLAQSRSATGEWTIQFFMPSRYTLASLPAPNDPAVRLAPVPPATFATVRFSGLGSPAAFRRETGVLMAAVQGTRWRPTGKPTAWFYDPPWTIPPLRRNEVAVQVEAATPLD